MNAELAAGSDLILGDAVVVALQAKVAHAGPNRAGVAKPTFASRRKTVPFWTSRAASFIPGEFFCNHNTPIH